MYIVEVFNLKPNHDLDEKAGEAHRAFLKKYADANVIIAAGQKVPRDGGVIVFADMPRERLDELLAEVPYLQGGLARCEVKEFKSNYLATPLRSPNSFVVSSPPHQFPHRSETVRLFSWKTSTGHRPQSRTRRRSRGRVRRRHHSPAFSGVPSHRGLSARSLTHRSSG